jgi:hypothetical protein
VIVFPDAVLWATDYLRRRLTDLGHADVFVGSKVPDPREPRMAVVRRVGGVGPNPFVDGPRLQVRVFGSTDEDATELAGLVRALLLASPGDGPVRRARDGGLVDVEDVQPLRLLTVDLLTRGAVA